MGYTAQYTQRTRKANTALKYLCWLTILTKVYNLKIPVGMKVQYYRAAGKYYAKNQLFLVRVGKIHRTC